MNRAAAPANTGSDTWDAVAQSIPRDLGMAEAWTWGDAAFVPLLPIVERIGVTLYFKPIPGTLAYDGVLDLSTLARARSSRRRDPQPLRKWAGIPAI